MAYNAQLDTAKDYQMAVQQYKMIIITFRDF